ncbi:hypothetical protein ACS0TY_013536 [Phlomoides rotata]
MRKVVRVRVHMRMIRMLWRKNIIMILMSLNFLMKIMIRLNTLFSIHPQYLILSLP